MTPETLTEKELQGLLANLASLSSALYGPNVDGRQIVIAATDDTDKSDKGRAEARYRALVEQIPAITFTVSLEEGAPEIYVGPQIEHILGFGQKEWMEDPILWFARCHPDDRDIWHQEFSRGIQTGGPFRATCRVFAKDGRLVWLHGEARLVRDDGGRPLFLQGVAFDVTDQKLAEQKMKEAEDIRVLNERLSAVGQMAASIGHDLRNPIGAIRNAWSLIQKRLADNDAARDDRRIQDMSAIIDRELGQCSTILSELLEFARDRPPHRRPVALRGLVDQVFSVVVKPIPALVLENDVPESMPAMNVDGDQLRQVLINLVQNGLEALGKTGFVRVSAERGEDAEAVIRVADNGKGIAPELASSIWKPLFTTKKRGTGLGLPIVANLVQRHDGLISFESAPGKGTTFRVTFPERAASTGEEPGEGGAVEKLGR